MKGPAGPFFVRVHVALCRRGEDRQGGKVLDLRNIAYSYPCTATASLDASAGVAALHDISLRVAPGERVALLGPNGSGKSTLLRCACMRVVPAAGDIVLNGRAVGRDLGMDELHRRVGYVGQDPDDQMVATTVFEEVAFGPCNLGLPTSEVHDRVAGALAVCNLAGFDARDVATLSGGQRQRVALAGVLAMQPDYLLLDEACSMLDVPARTGVLAAVNRAAEAGCGVLWVTHELGEVLDFDRAVVLDAGHVVWEGTPAELEQDCAALERAACFFPTALGETGGERARETLDACCEKGADSAQALVVDGVRHAYRRGRTVVAQALDGVNLTLERGEVVVLAGRTGSGKSTLAHVAAGLLCPDEGAVRLAGVPVCAGEVGFAFQRCAEQLFADTVLDDVAFGPRNRGRTKAQARASAERALVRVGLDPSRFGDVSPFALSGGQMRRAALAGVLAMETPFVVLDEPTVGLDARGVRDLARVVGGLAAEGVGVLVVTHDVARVAPFATRVMVLDAGRVVWEGPAEQSMAVLARMFGGVSCEGGGITCE